MICLSETYTGSGGVSGGAGSYGVGSPGNGLIGSPSQSLLGGSSSYGIPVIQLKTGVTQTVDIMLKSDVYGEVPYSIPDNASLRFITKEYINEGGTKLNLPVSVTDASQGTIKIDFPQKKIPCPGLWPAAVVVSVEDTTVAEFFCYFCLVMGLNKDTNYRKPEPITVGEIRMALMDFSPDYNTLLQDLEFSDTQIYAAMRRPVDEWNETPPDISRFNTTNFPFHEAWLKATCAYLLDSAAYRYTRNALPHNAGGLTMDPLNKGAMYHNEASLLKSEWKAFIASKKTELNMAACWGVSSINAFEPLSDVDYYDIL